jgi:hypothetical protein
MLLASGAEKMALNPAASYFLCCRREMSGHMKKNYHYLFSIPTVYMYVYIYIYIYIYI